MAPETIRALRDRYPSLEEAAIAAIRHPDYAAEFEQLGAEVWAVPEVDHIGRRREEREPAEVAWFPEAYAEAGRNLVVAVALADEAPGKGRPKTKSPRHRPPDPIPNETVKQLKWELAQRKARPHDPEFTQEKIAGRLKLHRTRVQQAEALKHVGWDLLRSHPEFSRDGLVRWPSAKEAARILASERAEN